jgi:hypothetical protein
VVAALGKSKAASAVVNQVLSEYAERGVFRSFSEVANRGGRREYRFFWLYNLQFTLVFDEARRELSFRKLLPGIAAGSAIDCELKEYLAGLSSKDRVEHRRLDTEKLQLRYSNQRGTVSIKFLMVDEDYEYAVKKSINLVNEVFLSFLNVRFPEYMIEKFKLSDE